MQLLAELSECPVDRAEWEQHVRSAPESAFEFRSRDALGAFLNQMTLEDRKVALTDRYSQHPLVRTMIEKVPESDVSVVEADSHAVKLAVNTLMQDWLRQVETALPYCVITNDGINVFENNELVHTLGDGNPQSWVMLRDDDNAWVQDIKTSVHTVTNKLRVKVDGKIQNVTEDEFVDMMPRHAVHDLGVVDRDVKVVTEAPHVVWTVGGHHYIAPNTTSIHGAVLASLDEFDRQQKQVAGLIHANAPEKNVAGRLEHVSKLFEQHETFERSWSCKTKFRQDGLYGKRDLTRSQQTP